MDTRKLHYAGHTAVTNFDGLPEDVAELRDENDLTIAYVVDPNVDLEMKRRWNNYEDIKQALDRFFDAMSVGVSVTFRTAEQQRNGDAAYAALKAAHTKATNP
jgi:hypothetical protein